MLPPGGAVRHPDSLCQRAIDELSQKAQSQTIHSSELRERAKKALQRSREIMKRVQLRKTSWNPPGR